MCGLAMIMEFDGKAPDVAALERMSEAMVHRGPDDRGRFTYKAFGLAFRRLAIIDISDAGRQPMHSGSGRFSIVFNGEIFNYIELRAELEKRGHTFTTNSDTEVLLDAYIEWKENCLSKLNGMWAFIIIDKHTGECFCARDRFGIKPLYYYLTRQRIVVASETGAIRASALHSGALDTATVSAYLFRNELDTTNDTFYSEIKSLAPGTYMKIAANGETQHVRYWSLPTERSCNVDAASIRDIFLDSVRLRLRSDVPVGVFLSGGLDSTSIICAAAREVGSGESLRAYSYMSERFDERQYIEATIRQTGATLIPLQVSDTDLWTQLLSMIRYQDAPVHTPSALIGYCLSRLAKDDGVKVILNGQGADETFAGYNSYFRNYWQTLFASAKFSRMISELRQYGAYYDLDVLGLFKQVITKFAKAQLNRARFYRLRASSHRQRLYEKSSFFSRELASCLRVPEASYRHIDLDRALERAIQSEPLPLYLRIEDRNSMANSIEVRVPFLDHRLVTAIMSIWSGIKIDGVLAKAIQRRAMAGVIPEVVRTRVDKMGFPTPDALWIRQWGSKIEEIFASRSFRERGFFQSENLLKALRLHVQGKADHHWEIFKALQLELWLCSIKHSS